ncbi:MAG: DUF4124 domain-containing protein [Gammaproteobacteria bacterium]|nr:DUF4124 domain-containing protein [Gammaproteobacteria bacterium]
MYRFFLFGLLLFTSPAIAEIFKWVDQNGVVHYGDKPTSNSEQMDVQVKESSPAQSNESREERRQRIADALESDRLDRQKQRDQDKSESERKNRECVYAKDRLKNYKRAGRLYKLDKDGNRVTLPDKSRDKAIADLQRQISIKCK